MRKLPLTENVENAEKYAHWSAENAENAADWLYSLSFLCISLKRKENLEQREGNRRREKKEIPQNMEKKDT